VAGFINYGLTEVKHDVIERMAEKTGQHALSPEAQQIVMIVGLASLGWTYLVFTTFFYLDKEGIKLIEHLGMKKKGEEATGCLQNVKDWILMWPSLVMYSVVSYWAILKVAVMGKKVCGHDPSSKEGLGKGLEAPAAAPTLLTSNPAQEEAKKSEAAQDKTDAATVEALGPAVSV